MNEAMKRLFRSETGSASVYWMIVLGALLMFVAVLIELLRVQAAELHGKYAADAAARSAHSAFRESLKNYGLFGLDAETAKSLYTEVVMRNLASSGGDSPRWIRATPRWLDDSLQTELSGNLADHDVFRRQILEDMKYRAPLEYIANVYEKVKSSPTLEETQQTAALVRRLEQLEDLIRQRDSALDMAWSAIKRMIGPEGSIMKAAAHNASALEEIGELAHRIADQSAAALAALAERLQTELAAIETALKGEEEEERRRELERQQQAKERELREVTALLETAHAYAAKVMDHRMDIEAQHAELARQLSEIQLRLREAKRINEELTRKASDLSPELQEIVPLLDVSYFDERDSAIGSLVGLHNGYANQFEPGGMLTGTDFTSRMSRLSDINETLRSEAASLYGRLLSAEQERIRRQQEARSLQEQERDRAETSMRAAWELAASCPPESDALYPEIKAKEAKYSAWNRHTDAEHGPPSDADLSDDAETAGKRALSLAEQLAGGLLAARDRAYVAEYALTRFNYRTMRPPVYEESDPLSHSLALQEAEYVLYGFGSCHLNQAAAFAEMFLLRLSVRTMEAMFEPKRGVAAASPWLLFLWSVAEGAGKAHEDMKKLIAGEEVEWSVRLPSKLTLNYKDYLRLFMLLHGGESARLSRMQALIETDTGVDLRKLWSRSRFAGQLEMSVPFLPDGLRLKGGTVTDGKVALTVTSEFAY